MKSCEDISSFVTEEKESDKEELKEAPKIIESPPNSPSKDIGNNETSALNPGNKDAPKVAEEKSKKGSVSKAVYMGYLRAGLSVFSGLVLFLATIGMNGSYSYSDIWLSEWTNSEDVQLKTYHEHLLGNDTYNSNITRPTVFDGPNENSTIFEEIKQIEESNKFYLMVYALLVLGLGKIEHFLSISSVFIDFHAMLFL